MKRKLVAVSEVWIQTYEIEVPDDATDQETIAALHVLLETGDGKVVDDAFEYSHTLGPECSAVETD